MPLTVRISLQSGPGELPLQSFLSDLMTDEADPPDLLFVGVPAADTEPESEPAAAAAAALDDRLPVASGKVLAAYGHEGEPGQAAETVIAVGAHAVRVVFLGTGDRTRSRPTRSSTSRPSRAPHG